MANNVQQERFRVQMHDAGLRVTGPRLSVLQVLANASAPLSHSQVTDRLETTGLDRATIYRNLNDLAEVGMLRRSDHGDHVWRFELASGSPGHPDHGHPHFICSQCGTVACLPGATFTVKASRAAPRSIPNGTFEVQLRGICDACH